MGNLLFFFPPLFSNLLMLYSLQYMPLSVSFRGRGLLGIQSKHREGWVSPLSRENSLDVDVLESLKGLILPPQLERLVIHLLRFSLP